jgi:trans-aconitate methyltransferase
MKNKTKYLWKDGKEFYDIQSKELFSHLDEVPFYHVGVVGDSPEDFIDYIINENGIDLTSKVVDFGCGGGYVVNKLSNLCEVEGISDSKECIKQARINYPSNKFLVENMETYSGRNKTHCLTLESLFYSNVEQTFNNTNKVLNKGGIFSIKEWFSLDNDDKYTLENREYWQDAMKYYPLKTLEVIKIAENNGFKLLKMKEIVNINSTYWEKSLKYHHSCMIDFESQYPSDKADYFIKSCQVNFIKL